MPIFIHYMLYCTRNKPFYRSITNVESKLKILRNYKDKKASTHVRKKLLMKTANILLAKDDLFRDGSYKIEFLNDH